MRKESNQMSAVQRRAAFAADVRARLAEIRVLLMFGPLPASWTDLGDTLNRESASLQSLLEWRRRTPR